MGAHVLTLHMALDSTVTWDTREPSVIGQAIDTAATVAVEAT